MLNLTLVNRELFYLIYNLHGGSHPLDQLMIFGAETLIFITIFLVLVLVFKGGARERRALFFIIGGAILAEVLIILIRVFYLEPRPFITLSITPLIKHAADASFPSGHTTIMSVIAFAYLFSKSKFFWGFLVTMLWVGLARIYVGVHYPLDILGGILLGFISVALIWILKKNLQRFFS